MGPVRRVVSPPPPKYLSRQILRNHTHSLTDLIHACSHTRALTSTKAYVRVVWPGSLMQHGGQEAVAAVSSSHPWGCSWQATTNQSGVTFHTLWELVMFTIFFFIVFSHPSQFLGKLNEFLFFFSHSLDILWLQSCSSSSWYLICRSGCSSSFCYLNEITGRVQLAQWACAISLTRVLPILLVPAHLLSHTHTLIHAHRLLLCLCSSPVLTLLVRITACRLME